MRIAVSLFEILTADRRCLISPLSLSPSINSQIRRMIEFGTFAGFILHSLHQAIASLLSLSSLSRTQQTSRQHEGENIDDSHPHSACAPSPSPRVEQSVPSPLLLRPLLFRLAVLFNLAGIQCRLSLLMPVPS